MAWPPRLVGISCSSAGSGSFVNRGVGKGLGVGEAGGVGLPSVPVWLGVGAGLVLEQAASTHIRAKREGSRDARNGPGETSPGGRAAAKGRIGMGAAMIPAAR